jgi:hypothetical protein
MMGLEQRHSNVYLYRKERRGRTVHSVYVAGGEAAKVFQASDALIRQIKAEERQAELEERDGGRDQARRLNALSKACQALAGLALIEAGYHQHKRGEWRKRRTMDEPQQTEDRAQRIVALIRAAEAADKEKSPVAPAALEVSNLAKRMPDIAAMLGDLHSKAVEGILTHHIAAGQGAGTLVRARLQEIRENLSPAQSPLEVLLIEDIALCWLRYHVADLAVSHRGSVNAKTFENGDFYDRLLSTAHRRYLRSIETLARVRRLGAVQVNVAIGGQQLNAQL